MRVEHAMSTPAVGVVPEATVEEAARRMTEAKVGFLPVVRDGAVLGTLTARDLVTRVLACRLPGESRVELVMSQDPVTVEVHSEMTEALYRMRCVRARRLPVVSEGRLVGVLSLDDLFHYADRGLTDMAEVVEAARDRRTSADH
ncbi:CBS domain-containing protein [Streptomyces sp. ICBB 8177]|uniref:CBS domain-containing protein n=1 Tax=Streptomyces sp. ICBB 8177 TaxID=563922 RepID=UPI0013051422|nr:CBS domain-containing protein [Streptomyces sp. ICBB 8177]